jgi:hypothetical protein
MNPLLNIIHETIFSTLDTHLSKCCSDYTGYFYCSCISGICFVCETIKDNTFKVEYKTGLWKSLITEMGDIVFVPRFADCEDQLFLMELKLFYNFLKIHDKFFRPTCFMVKNLPCNKVGLYLGIDLSPDVDRSCAFVLGRYGINTIMSCRTFTSHGCYHNVYLNKNV